MPSAVAANIVFGRRNPSIRATTIAEVVIAFWSDWLPGIGQETCTTCDGADSDSRDTRARWGGVEELVVFAVVERLFLRGSFEQWNVVEGGRDLRCLAETVQIEGESVADVDTRGRFASELAAFFEARRYVTSMAPAAECTRDVDGIAGARAVAAKRLVAGDGAADHYVAHELIRMGEVAAGERRVGLVCEFEQTGEKLVHPLFVGPTRQCERHQAETRSRTHGGDIAETARECAPWNRPGGLFKMHTLHKQICREHKVLTRSRAIDRAIVPNTQYQVAMLARQLRKNRLFGHTEPSAITSPDGSSSPNTLPRSSSSTPSRTGSKASGTVRRTSSRVEEEDLGKVFG